jgi:hypothetical protein
MSIQPIAFKVIGMAFARATRHAAAKGATVQRSGWGGTGIGFMPFPIDKLGPLPTTG